MNPERLAELERALRIALAAYSESEEHEGKCIGASERQWCCIDAGHPNFERLLGVVMEAISDATPS